MLIFALTCAVSTRASSVAPSQCPLLHGLAPDVMENIMRFADQQPAILGDAPVTHTDLSHLHWAYSLAASSSQRDEADRPRRTIQFFITRQEDENAGYFLTPNIRQPMPGEARGTVLQRHPGWLPAPVRIGRVDENSPAWRAGMRPEHIGWTITHINEEPLVGDGKEQIARTKQPRKVFSLTLREPLWGESGYFDQHDTSALGDAVPAMCMMRAVGLKDGDLKITITPTSPQTFDMKLEPRAGLVEEWQRTGRFEAGIFLIQRLQSRFTLKDLCRRMWFIELAKQSQGSMVERTYDFQTKWLPVEATLPSNPVEITPICGCVPVACAVPILRGFANCIGI